MSLSIQSARAFGRTRPRRTRARRPLEELARRATAEAIGSRRHRFHEFASIFRGVAHAREGGWSGDIPSFHLRESVSRADEKLAARIADASAHPVTRNR